MFYYVDDSVWLGDYYKGSDHNNIKFCVRVTSLWKKWFCWKRVKIKVKKWVKKFRSVSYTHLDVYKRQVWEIRADKFRSEGSGVGSGQRAALWQVVEQFKGVFADVPGRAKDYECTLQIREHTPFMQRSYPVPY